jgi:CheY-like chemotaxis protein
MRILIAEDDLTSRAMLQAVLTRWGYNVIAVKDGNEGCWGDGQWVLGVGCGRSEG